MLSARLFLVPQLVDERLYFISNMSGKMSLYAMDYGGSVPEPLLPPDIALQNPALMNGYSYVVFPNLKKIMVMIDKDGDENYQPKLIPLDGGYPEPAFGDHFDDYRVHCHKSFPEKNLVYLSAESRKESMNEAYRANLQDGTLVKLGQSVWGSYTDGVNQDHTMGTLIDSYMPGDHAVFLWTEESEEPQLLYGKPLEDRQPDEEVPVNSIGAAHFLPGDKNLLVFTSLFEDTYGLGILNLEGPPQVNPVTISGQVHTGHGELYNLEHLKEDLFLLTYNIDGVSWVYEGRFDEAANEMQLIRAIVGEGELANGVESHVAYDKKSDRYSLSFSTATTPTQLYTIEGPDRKVIVRHTNERILAIPEEWLSDGEDASYDSFDGLRVSARLYLPAEALGFAGARPLVYYVHGGPQSQERPDFAWFSMPLIQFLTIHGFAVFVPNVRGSSGYGLEYMRKIDHDWGGDDRLDHVHALKVLEGDGRVDISRAGVVGRSYGGYMTLTQAGRHPELWSAAVDMFGPYDLFTFMDRLPETWKPYFEIALGHPEKDRDYIIDRSPKTHLGQMTCPMLVIQGKNDPRVVEQESRDLVEELRSQGKEIEYLMFEDEGHDVIKFDNRVLCYNAIMDFFKRTLKP
jgi:esterase/lipase